MTAPTTRRTVGILAFDDMEVLDHAGPYEVFNVAGELSDDTAFSVLAVGVGEGLRTGRGGFAVQPAVTLDDAPALDVVVVPGGVGSRTLLRDEQVLSWLRDRAEDAELLLSVCTGSLVLAAAGLLRDRRATTHHGSFELLAELDPTIEVVRDERYVRSSPTTWTSGGISAGVDLSLRIVEELHGRGLRDAVVEEMEWGWHA